MESQPMVTFVPFNRCLECGAKVVVIQTETNIIELDKKGLPISTDNIAIDTKLRCTNCGKVSDANIISMRYIEKTNVIPLRRKRNNPFGKDEKD